MCFYGKQPQEKNKIRTLDKPDAVLERPTISYHDNETIAAVSTGLETLDTLLCGGLHNGDFILLGAGGGMGKTALALSIAVNVAKKQRKNVAWFSLAESRKEICRRADILQGCLENGKWQADIRIFEESMITAAKIADDCKRTDNLGLIVVDYLQLMLCGCPKEQIVLEQSRIVSELKAAVAQALNVPLLCVYCRSCRLQAQPRLNDLRINSTAEQSADVVLFLYEDRTKKTGTTDCIVAKNRHGDCGTLGIRRNPECLCYTDL